MFTRYLLLVSFFVTSNILNAQEKTENDTKFSLGLEGMIGVSGGNDFYSVNVGGPNFQILIGKKLRVGAGAFPSFYLHRNKAGARLGVGPRVDYKNLVVFAPFFHRESANEWIWSVGLGYKFHRKQVCIP